MKDYEGTTLNERLFLSGKLGAFEKALKNRDKIKLKAILESVGIENPDVEPFLTNPKTEHTSLFKRIFKWKIFLSSF